MCEQTDAMRAVRAAAECLSAACRARRSPTMKALSDLYDGTVAEPVPPRLKETLGRLDADSRQTERPH